MTEGNVTKSAPWSVVDDEGLHRAVVSRLASVLDAVAMIVNKRRSLDPDGVFVDTYALGRDLLALEVTMPHAVAPLHLNLPTTLFQETLDRADQFIETGETSALEELRSVLHHLVVQMLSSFLIVTRDTPRTMIKSWGSLGEQDWNMVTNELRSIDQRLAALGTLEKIREASARAAAVTADVQRATDTIGERAIQHSVDDLSEFFADHGRRQRALAARWTNLTIGLLVLIGIGGVLLYFTIEDEGVTWFDLLHYLIVLPFVAVAIYAAKIANLHRHRADWALTAAVQLSAITDYTANFRDDEKQALRLEFGQRVFGSPGGQAQNIMPPNFIEDSKSTIEQLKSVVATLTDAVKAIKPGA